MKSMDGIEEYIEKLNLMLEYESFQENVFIDLLIEFRLKFKIKLSIVDLKQLKDKIQQAQMEKIRALRFEDFEKMAKWRDIEKEYTEILGLLSNFQIEKSMFYLEDNHIFFIYIGNTQNDKKVKSLLKQFVTDHYNK